MRECPSCREREVLPGNSKCRPCRNEYMRAYMAERYAARRQMALDFLGGACAVCGSSNDLELDHKDRSTKTIDIAKLILAKDEKLFAELVKCQVLCASHHDTKTSLERSVPHGGGAKGRRGCPCPLCLEARRTYNRNYLRMKRARIAQR